MAGREDIFQKAMNIGHSAAWDQQWDKAVTAYQSALAEFPDNPKALTSLGLALYEQQRYEEALQIYKKATQVSPGDPLPLEKVGLLSERTGNLKEAIQSFLKVAELYAREQDAQKAIENWSRVTRLDSDNITARNYLALVHEWLGHIQQSVNEYLAVASLYQRAGNANKAAEMVGRALHLQPDNALARQAQTMLKNGQVLPKPLHSQGGTGMLRMPQPKQLQAPTAADSGLDPIQEARKKALARLAEVLFEFTEEAAANSGTRRGMQSIVRAAGQTTEGEKPGEPSKLTLYLSQAIESQTKNQDTQAAEELEKAIEAGFRDPAIYFDLGLMRSGTERQESALRNLQISVRHEDYALASRLLMGDINHKMSRLSESLVEYLEALKIADSLVVPADQAAAIRQLYEPLIESQSQQSDPAEMERLCATIHQMLVRANWRAEVLQSREQLPKPSAGMGPLPLAEVLVQAQSGQIIEAINQILQLARKGNLRSAMDVAFDALKTDPTYLPLHSLIGDLLLQETPPRTAEAIAKFMTVATAYSVRGEAPQAIALLKHIIQVAPMDMAARTRLIDQLAAHGQIDEAIGEYLDLADIYYRLAELDLARKTYSSALHLAQQGGANRAWSVKLLQRMADIDMQRLDWKQAMRVYEQIRTIQPDDIPTRKTLVDLNLRLNQPEQVATELESYMSYLQNTGRRREAIPFLEDLVKENPQQAVLHRTLAEEYRLAGRKGDAVTQLDTLGELLLSQKDRDGALQVVEAIIALDPANMDQYQILLSQLKGTPA
jgi:tetratricopeptide (TPR) repeat protein